MKPVYLVMQQGGSTCEWYAWLFDGLEAAWDYRRECEDEAGYATLGPYKLPEALAKVLKRDDPELDIALAQLCGRIAQDVAGEATPAGGVHAPDDGSFIDVEG